MATNRTSGLSTERRNRMRSETFAFPKERKEPLNDAPTCATRSLASTRSEA